MTTEQQRIIIAEFCGWKWKKNEYNWMRWWLNEKEYKEIPDYPNCLNAMHDAEKKLDVHQRLDYCGELGRVGDYRFQCDLISATAKQRAEAFIRTIGKWVE